MVSTFRISLLGVGEPSVTKRTEAAWVEPRQKAAKATAIAGKLEAAFDFLILPAIKLVGARGDGNVWTRTAEDRCFGFMILFVVS